MNLTGAILGSLLAGFILLPFLGSRGSLVLTSTVIFASGIALVLAAAPVTRRRATAVAILSAVFLGAGAVIGDPFTAFLKVHYPEDQLVWREESVQATVSVHRRGPRYALFVEGNHQASDAGEMVSVHRRIGHLGLVVHPDPKRVLVIGLGGGATAGAASVHEGVQVDVVELSRAVVRGAEFFTHINHNLLKRPNVHVRVDDGRNYLMTTTQKYDVITADIIVPIFAGSTNLYSADYFALVRRALTPGGVFVQWVSGTEAEYKTIARTFLSVFPEATVWDDGTKLLGSNAPIRLRPEDFERKRQIPGRQFALDDAGIPSFESLAGLFRAGPADLRAFVGSGPILTDNWPLVEYFLSLPRHRDIDLAPLRGDVGPYLR